MKEWPLVFVGDLKTESIYEGSSRYTFRLWNFDPLKLKFQWETFMQILSAIYTPKWIFKTKFLRDIGSKGVDTINK